MDLKNIEGPIAIDLLAVELELEVEDLAEILKELDIEPTDTDTDGDEYEYEFTLAEAVLLQDEVEDWKGETK